VLHCIINHQDTLTFEKVFNIGLKQMIGLQKCLLTDQDKAISKAIDNIFKDQVYHVYCSRHAKENMEKHIACLVSPNSFKELSAEDKISMHSKLLGLFKEISKEKATRDIDFLLLNLPENEMKNYFKKTISTIY